MLSTSKSLFSLAWVAGLRRIPESAMAATVTVYEITGRSWNSATDTWTSHRTTYYTGKARVQPVQSARLRAMMGDDTTAQTVLFSIPVTENDLDLRTDLLADVTVSPLNPDLVHYQYTIAQIMDSSNPIERTFFCTVNQEVVV